MERKGERRWEENPDIHIGVTPQQIVTKTYILAFFPYLSETNIKSKNLPYTTTSKFAYDHTHTLLNDINSDACSNVVYSYWILYNTPGCVWVLTIIWY